MRRAAKHAGKYILLLIMLVCFGHILDMGRPSAPITLESPST